MAAALLVNWIAVVHGSQCSRIVQGVQTLRDSTLGAATHISLVLSHAHADTAAHHWHCCQTEVGQGSPEWATLKLPIVRKVLPQAWRRHALYAVSTAQYHIRKTLYLVHSGDCHSRASSCSAHERSTQLCGGFTINVIPVLLVILANSSRAGC